MTKIHAFTVDLEDWFDGVPLRGAEKSSWEPRLGIGMGVLRDMLETHSTKATFYVLGRVAGAHPGLIRQLAREGHEIGCHGLTHDLVYELGPKRFRDETRTAVARITEITGRAVVSYRAPYFSLTARSLWALEILAELGFRHDSSVFPVRNWRYGIVDFTPVPHRVTTPSGDLIEFPISVRRVLGSNVPVSGGAYFRLYPYWLTKRNIEAHARGGLPVIFYIHPWELDPHHPRADFDRRARLTHYMNLASTAPKLERLLGDFRFSTLSGVAAEYGINPRAAGVSSL